MSDVFQVVTNNIIPTRKAEIDGVIYTVRRKGSGDDLDISLRTSRLSKLGREAMAERARLSSAKSEKEKEDINERILKIVDEIAELNKEMELILANLFDDGGDQSKSRELVHKYGADGVTNILGQIFGQESGTDGNE